MAGRNPPALGVIISALEDPFGMPDAGDTRQSPTREATRTPLLRFEGGSLARQLRQALGSGQITPVFQPLLDLRTRRISGFEMLARWYDPVLGHLPPDQFIPIADAEGLLTPLTEQLLSQACAAAIHWPSHLTLAVNISPLQLEDASLPSRIERIAGQHGFALSRLEVEITEQALMGPIELVRSTVAQLKALGIVIVMDDFGVGHASLSRLKQLPFDKIKIDRSFVESMGSGPESAKIISAIIRLGLSLGVTTIAEGVEDQEQADKLATLGCAMSQGWLYGRPVSAEKVPALLEAARALAMGTSPLSIVAPTEAGEDAEGKEYDDEQDQPPRKGSDRGMAALSADERLDLLESIFHAAPVGLGYIGRDFRYVTVNDHFARLHGLSPSAFIGRTVRQSLPRLAPQIMAHLERSLASEARVEWETTADGPPDAGTCAGPAAADSAALAHHPRILLRTAQPVWNESGEIGGISVAILDITERKRTEARLTESEEDLRYTVELNPHIPWTCDPSGDMLTMSPRWHALTGNAPNQNLNERWIRYIHPDDLEATIAEFKQAIQSGEPLDSSFRLACADLGWRWMRSRAFPRRSAAGKILRWYGTLEDIHDRKLVEAAVLSKTKRLEKATEQLARRAREDHLTGLANRRQFDETLEREVGRARRAGPDAPLALVMIDVDQFKVYNDTYGHLAGDECLREVACALSGALWRGRVCDAAAKHHRGGCPRGGAACVRSHSRAPSAAHGLIARRGDDQRRGRGSARHQRRIRRGARHRPAPDRRLCSLCR
jgi:PAS domain S-box-containing protein